MCKKSNVQFDIQFLIHNSHAFSGQEELLAPAALTMEVGITMGIFTVAVLKSDSSQIWWPLPYYLIRQMDFEGNLRQHLIMAISISKALSLLQNK